jgi:hypothetical protein
MSEASCRTAVSARSGGLCEVTGLRAGEMSHRIARGRAGAWTPSNIIHLAPEMHRWITQTGAGVAAGYAGGWFVRSGVGPQRVPVWLARPYPGWWTIEDDPADGGPHLLHPAAVNRPPPILPGFWTTHTRKGV